MSSIFKCPDCNEIIEVFNNDIKRSLQFHSQKHRPVSLQPQPEDQSSVSSTKSKNLSKRGSKHNNAPKNTSEQSSVLDSIFGAMPPGLKSHRGFVFENKSGDTVCSICNSNIDSLSKIADHLKTKLHEDNTISFIKNKLSNDLQEIMEFVSFCGSNLYCNLCRYKIELCSKNPYKTIVNIMTHNSDKMHSNKKPNHDTANHMQEASQLLDTFAVLSPSINNGKHLIGCRMEPRFCCNLCDKQINYDSSDKVLLQNFISHLGSAGHTKNLQSSTVLSSFQTTYKPTKIKHDLIAVKGSIFCNTCNCHVEVSQEKLSRHVAETNDFDNIEWPSNLSALLSSLRFEDLLYQNQNNTSTVQNKAQLETHLFHPVKEPDHDTVLALTDLLKLLPESYQNITFLTEKEKGKVTCSICDFTIAATVNNVISHITGNGHTEAFLQQLGSVEKEPVVENKVKALLNTLPEPYQNITYIVETEQGQVQCLICNCTLPATTNNLETHLLGNNHKTNEQKLMSIESVDEEKVNQNTVNIRALLKSLPQQFRNVSYIVNNDQGNVFCLICNCVVPSSTRYLEMHLLCNNHKTNEQHALNAETILKRTVSTNSKVTQLLDFLPPPFNKVNYIVESTSSQDQVTCLICNCFIPATIQSIESHLTSRHHPQNEQGLSKSAGKVSDSEASKVFDQLNSNLSANTDDPTLLQNNGASREQSDVLLNKLKRNYPIINNISKHVSVKNDMYFCQVCDILISRTQNETILEELLTSHFSNPIHKTTFSNKQDELFKEVFTKDPILKANKKHVKKQEGEVICILCDRAMSISIEKEKFLKNIMAHFTGKEHAKASQNIQENKPDYNTVLALTDLLKLLPEYYQNVMFLTEKEKGKVTCSICDSTIAATVNNVISHITGNDHKEAFLQQLGSVEKEPVVENKVKTLLNTLPKPFKNITYIVETEQGQVQCLICNCTLPATTNNLETHLLGNNHKTNEQKLMKAESIDKGKVNQNTVNIRALLKSLPQQFRNVNYIVENDQGQVFCLICNCVVPSSTHNLETHLLGNNHKTNEQLALNRETTLKRTVSTNSKVTQLLHLLPPPFNKVNYIVENTSSPDLLTCLICNCFIPATIQSIKSHLTSLYHPKIEQGLSKSAGKVSDSGASKVFVQLNPNISANNTVDPTLLQNNGAYREQSEVLLNKLKRNDVIINKLSKYVSVKNDMYFCQVCDILISRTQNETILGELLTSHFSSPIHKTTFSNKQDELFKEVFTKDPILKANKKHVMMQEGEVICILCDRAMSISVEKVKFLKSIMAHFTGKEHLKASQNIQEQEVLPSKISENTSYPEFIKTCFVKLPYKFQEDIAYMECSSVDGYLKCTLCCSIINPYYLKNHLEEFRHLELKNKKVNKNSPNLGASQNFSEAQKSMQTMRNYLSRENK